MVGQPLAGLLIEHHLSAWYGVAAGAFALVGAFLSVSPEPSLAGER
jgi:hypothetical protein